MHSQIFLTELGGLESDQRSGQSCNQFFYGADALRQSLGSAAAAEERAQGSFQRPFQYVKFKRSGAEDISRPCM